MYTELEKYANIKPIEDFDWSVYEDGWNGKSLKVNKRVKNKSGEKIYCHEPYAASLLKKYSPNDNSEQEFDNGVKDLTEGDVIRIKDVRLIGKDELLLSTSTGGSAIVNLVKENKFFDMFEMNREEFKDVYFGTPEGRAKFVNSGYLAKIEKNGKASLYQGTLIKTEQEFKHQIELGDKADRYYRGKIIGSNNGGYIMDVLGIKCFLPGSQATSNKVIDFKSLLGTEMEVMILRYLEGSGFLVSRKKYLQKIQPMMIDQLRTEWSKDPEKIYKGSVTGARHFGIFIELNEFYTGLLHRTYVTEDVLSKILPIEGEMDSDGNAKRNFKPGSEIEVKIYNITDDNRIIFTNIMDKSERDAIVAERERIEKEAEEKAKAEAEEQRKIAEEQKQKKMQKKADKSFKGETVSLEDLRSK